MDRKTNLLKLTKEVAEKHANFLVSEVNDHCMRIAVLEGKYVWISIPAQMSCLLFWKGSC